MPRFNGRGPVFAGGGERVSLGSFHYWRCSSQYASTRHKFGASDTSRKQWEPSCLHCRIGHEDDAIKYVYTWPQAPMVTEMLRYGPTWYLKISWTSVRVSGLVVGPTAELAQISTITARQYRAVVLSTASWTVSLKRGTRFVAASLLAADKVRLLGKVEEEKLRRGA